MARKPGKPDYIQVADLAGALLLALQTMAGRPVIVYYLGTGGYTMQAAGPPRRVYSGQTQGQPTVRRRPDWPPGRAPGWRRVAVLVMIVGIVLRLALASVNTQANDDHLAVIRAILFEHRIPEKIEISRAYEPDGAGPKPRPAPGELSEDFQPKLYHLAVAALWDVLSPRLPVELIHLAQWVSCAAGIWMLLAVWNFLNGVDLSGRTRMLAVGLVALNPKLIGIEAQATNDSFVILFGTLTLICGYRFFTTWRWPALVSTITWAILAALSKGNGLVLLAAVAATLGIALLHPRSHPAISRRRLAGLSALLLVVYFVLVPFLGPYWYDTTRFGTPFVINWEPKPLPQLVQKTYALRAGVTSIVDSYLTFRLIDLIEHPVITNGVPPIPLHRTSLWTQIYGRTHFVQFDEWPPSWQTQDPLVLDLGRVILILALFPTGLVVLGAVRVAAGPILVLSRQSRTGSSAQPVALGEALLTLAVLGYLAFIIFYSARYRDFSTMKAVFLFPAMLGFVMLFAGECERLYAWCRRSRWICIAANGLFAALFLAYTLDVVLLFGQLLMWQLF